MVYNNVNYAPVSLTDKLRARLGDRVAGAIFRAHTAENDGEVLSFFGRADDTVIADRAIPYRRKAQMKPRDTAEYERSSANVKNAYAAPRKSDSRRTGNARPVQNVRTDKSGARPAANVKRANSRTDSRRTAPKMPQVNPVEARLKAGALKNAYAAGERVKNISSKVRTYSERRYEDRDVSDRELKAGRSDIAGSRHAVLKYDSTLAAETGRFAKFRESVKDIQKAEHRIKSTPLPIAYAAVIIICAIMAMVLLFSHSQVSERKGMIGDLSSRYEQLADNTAKLELKLETRDDIRNIRTIALESLGMVSSDVAQTRFVSVTADDKVEILREEPEETESGFSALLSAIGESIGQWSEYFN